MEIKEQGFRPTTNKDEILNELKQSNNVIVITTYQSSDLLLDSCKELKFKFDLSIFDEAHRSTGKADRLFTHLLSDEYNISKKRLFMTATERIFDYSNIEDEETILSMDNEDIYGKVIYIMSLRQAIEDGALVNYNIIAPFISTDKYQNLIINNKFIKDSNDEEIYDSKIISLAFMILHTRTTYKYTHLLIFSYLNENAEKIINVIKKLSPQFFKEDDDVYYKYLSSDHTMKTRKLEVEKFKKAKKGIISSARIFNEGVDIKICDAVCFADNKESSKDIIQCVGRCLRKYENKPDKIASVIIPFFCEIQEKFFDNSNKSYKKIRLILKSLASTDNMVSDRFSLVNCNGEGTSRGSSSNELENNIAKKIDIKELQNNIISKIFDKSGNPEPRLRRILNKKNKELSNKNKELIDTKKKCIEFLKEKGYPEPPIKVKDDNWVKWCLGDSLYEEIKEKYHKKEDLVQACHNIGIHDMESYKKNHTKDKRLPPSDYINDGFYSKLNLTTLLDSNLDIIDF